MAGLRSTFLAGCGGDEAAELTAAEEADVAAFNADVAQTAFEGVSGGGDGSTYGELLNSIDTTIAIAREKPDAEYDGRTMEQVLGDAASELQPYEPDLAAELDRAVATLE